MRQRLIIILTVKVTGLATVYFGTILYPCSPRCGVVCCVMATQNENRYLDLLKAHTAIRRGRFSGDDVFTHTEPQNPAEHRNSKKGSSRATREVSASELNYQRQNFFPRVIDPPPIRGITETTLCRAERTSCALAELFSSWSFGERDPANLLLRR